MFGKQQFFYKKNKKSRFKHRIFFRKSFKNPYFLKNILPKRTRAPRLKIFLGLGAVLATFAIFFFHPFFNITVIQKEGLQKISPAEIESLINSVLNQNFLGIFNFRNIFLVKESQIKEEILKRYSLDELRIEKKIPRTLIISVKEKKPKFVLEAGESNSQMFLLDDDGKIIQELKNKNSFDFFSAGLPRVQIVNLDKKIEFNEQYISRASGDFINYLNQSLAKSKISVSIFVITDKEGRVLNLITSEGWKVIVDRHNDWEKQMQVLTIILRDKIKENRSKLRYIDVRFENRSYYQ